MSISSKFLPNRLGNGIKTNRIMSQEFCSRLYRAASCFITGRSLSDCSNFNSRTLNSSHSSIYIFRMIYSTALFKSLISIVPAYLRWPPAHHHLQWRHQPHIRARIANTSAHIGRRLDSVRESSWITWRKTAQHHAECVDLTVHSDIYYVVK